MVRRRQLLLTGLRGAAGLASLSLFSVLGCAGQASALGGVPPALDQPAPDFNLAGVVPDGAGNPVEARVGLADYQGRWLVLYFYPRDFTSGCTLEARGFQQQLAAFTRAQAAVVGVSADAPDSHAAFCGSEHLAFPLLSDPGGEVSRRYGSWLAPFSMRHTFLVDPEGVLRASWSGVRPSGHASEVLERLLALKSAG